MINSFNDAETKDGNDEMRIREGTVDDVKLIQRYKDERRQRRNVD